MYAAREPAISVKFVFDQHLSIMGRHTCNEGSKSTGSKAPLSDGSSPVGHHASTVLYFISRLSLWLALLLTGSEPTGWPAPLQESLPSTGLFCPLFAYILLDVGRVFLSPCTSLYFQVHVISVGRGLITAVPSSTDLLKPRCPHSIRPHPPSVTVFIGSASSGKRARTPWQ